MLNDLSPKKNQIVFGDDSIVIKKYIAGIEGGRTLTLTDSTGTELVSGNVIKAGHVIIKTDTGLYFPAPVAGEAYDLATLEGEPVGVLYRTILKSNPVASIMVAGVVNEAALPYPADDFKGNMPHIIFTKDEEA